MPADTHNFDLQSADEKAGSDSSKAIGAALLGAFAMVLALICIDVLVINGAQASAKPATHPTIVKLSDAQPVLSTVYLTVSPGIKPGPDGKLHDAFSVTNFTVHAGQPVKLVINNTDNSPHSITAMSAGVNILVRPGLHTYTLLVRKVGRFEWMCTQPCDPYSMAHIGYMRGYITSI